MKAGHFSAKIPGQLSAEINMLERLRRSRSQLWLMAIVFASRLVPFISFDAVSYLLTRSCSLEIGNLRV
jgi:hypothetical protein